MSQDLEAFRKQVDDLVAAHPVVTDNRYAEWFATGEADLEEVKSFTVQFSVFSHLFIEAQLRKVINAPNLEQYRAGKEILMNELGVVFRQKEGQTKQATTEIDPDVVSVEGTIEGGTFRFRAAHFEWMLRFADVLGLGFDDLGKRRHGTESTLFFCDELLRIYGSEDPSTAAGASYAVEHWAAAGFWKQLIAGLKAFKGSAGLDLPLGFWTWHDQLEEQHAAHTDDELAEAFEAPGFDQARFLEGAKEMLDGVQVFWDGLWQDRLTRAEQLPA